MASVSVPWSHCAKKSWEHEIIKTINSCGYSTFYNTDHFSCSCERIGNPGAKGGNDVTWGTKRSENKKSGSLWSAGEIDVNPFTPMPSVSSLVSSGLGRRDGGHFRLLQCCVLLTFHVVQNQNAGDHITSSKMIRFRFM